MRGDPLAILRGERRDHARGLPHAPHVSGREQQAQISSTPEFVQADEACAQFGAFGELFLLEPATLPVERVELLRRGVHPCVGPSQFLRLDLPLELELLQVAKERSFLCREAISLAVERLQPIGGATRQRLGLRAIGLLRAERAAEQRDKSGGGDAR